MRPNLIIIVADDLGYGDLGCFGNPAVSTPHLDRLAREGIVLTQHYSGSPMCAPARACLLTGKYPQRTGAIDVPENRGLDRIALCHRTIGDLTQAHGYATGLIGKWHNGAIDPRFHPNRRGFAEFVGFQAGIMDYWDWIIQRNGTYTRADGRYLTDVFTSEAVHFIHRHRQEPFLLWIAYNAPHTPLQAPESAIAPFRNCGAFTEAVSRIYAMNQCLDAGIGRVLEQLEKDGLAENTIVLFVSDNGPMFRGTGDNDTRRYNGIFSGSKGDVLEGGIRVPGILRWPAGLPASIVCDSLVHFTDWLPTLLTCCDLPHPPDLDGHNALGSLQNKQFHEGDSLRETAPVRFWQWNRYTPVSHCNAAVRDAEWKLYWPPKEEAMRKLPEDNRLSELERMNPGTLADITRSKVERHIPTDRKPRLFNLQEDPAEKRDLSGKHTDITARLTKALDDWFGDVERQRRAMPENIRGY